MAKASEQFRQSDVTTWGIVALVAAALAVLGANVAASLPQGVLSGLHQSRLQGASLDQLRLQVADLRSQTIALKQENSTLLSRFSLEEERSSDVQQRVGALEVSLPKLLEALPDDAEIDRSNLTASIGDTPAQSFEAQGGSVEVRQRPLVEALPPVLPGQTTADVSTSAAPVFGVAIGPAVSDAQAAATWRDLSVKVGPLLLGLSPRLADGPDKQSKSLVAGPFDQVGEATALCQRLERVSISCLPVPYAGIPLQQ